MASEILIKEAYPQETAPSIPRKTQPARRNKAIPDRDRRARERLILVGGLVFVTIFVLFILTRYASIMVNNYNLQTMQSNLNAQSSQNASVEAQVSELSSPTRILNYAENILKMKSATPVAVGASHP